MTARVLSSGADSGVKDLKGLNGATVCVAQERHTRCARRLRVAPTGSEWKPLVFDRIDTIIRRFFGGRCDA